MAKHFVHDTNDVHDIASSEDVYLAQNVEHTKKDKPSFGCLRSVFSWFLVIGCAFVLAFFVRMYVAEPFVVPTGSMLETIQLDDRLFGEKISYFFRDPEAGDIVTFVDPTDGETILIKRVIAVAGQTIDIYDGVVYVDGVALDEPYTTGATEVLNQWASELLDEPISYPYTVPEGYVWVMGDNRANSLDSRYFGAISIDSITSRAWLIYWPLEDIATL